ncbi:MULTISPECIES: hypothetical protein [Methylobacterium]|uniref:hypothetical protein n=1 Tax=Methylobacterium TaxID=407 RepID=UPI00034978EF|nr:MULTISPECIES: hypothetical protein [Methylobacterium]MBN4093695.1 hypothetical protein [Methylobacterium sp. OT2]UIN33855.1 hypothetical protein LXM90_22625 [Methylobacterium oryzae]SEF54830.1 hypothetical protein SAMN04488144_102111 [Methylobacterium sp. 190mf]SFS32096.1 hypothetical protein SAMN04487845_101176 [Methylobacterium sp. yr668]
MRRLVLSTALVLLAGTARAEDFTGFYAGINAGYGWGHARDGRAVGPAPGSAAAFSKPDPGADLPPSARNAAVAIRRPSRDGASGAAGP